MGLLVQRNWLQHKSLFEKNKNKNEASVFFSESAYSVVTFQLRNLC